MKDNNIKIENRLENMKNFYIHAGQLIDSLPNGISEDTKKLIKDKVLGDKELKKLMDGIDAHRPPRIFLIGRTGTGKSSLINALCGSYVASVSDTRSCTEVAKSYLCKDGDRVLMEIMDTRGIAESEALDDSITAEDMLMEQINDFSPDVAIMVLECTHRDDVRSDADFLKKAADHYAKVNKMRLPVVVVINKSDEMAPGRVKEPENYPTNKVDKIEDVVRYFKGIIVRSGLKIDDIIAVSSYIEWMTPDGMEIPVEDIDKLPKRDIDNLQMSFDGRYKIEELLDILEAAIPDCEAQMGLRMAARLQGVVERFSKQLIKIFSGISGTIGLTPIPISDVYVLVLLQTVLVVFIAALSGRELSLEAAKEFIFSMGGVAGLGWGLRIFAQQAAKILNAIWPGSGSVASALIAGGGTSAIGKAAIAYYINDMSIEVAKEQFVHEQKMRYKK